LFLLFFLSEKEVSSELEDISSSLEFASPGLEVSKSQTSQLETLESGSSDDELAGIFGLGRDEGLRGGLREGLLFDDESRY